MASTLKQLKYFSYNTGGQVWLSRWQCFYKL